jgi:hypothetical protein
MVSQYEQITQLHHVRILQHLVVTWVISEDLEAIDTEEEDVTGTEDMGIDTAVIDMVAIVVDPLTVAIEIAIIEIVIITTEIEKGIDVITINLFY